MELGGLRDPFSDQNLSFVGFWIAKVYIFFRNRRLKLSPAEKKILRNNKIKWNWKRQKVGNRLFSQFDLSGTNETREKCPHSLLDT
jgi:hypothetical protein